MDAMDFIESLITSNHREVSLPMRVAISGLLHLLFCTKMGASCHIVCGRTGLSAPIPRNRYAIPAGFPLLSLARISIPSFSEIEFYAAMVNAGTMVAIWECLDLLREKPFESKTITSFIHIYKLS